MTKCDPCGRGADGARLELAPDARSECCGTCPWRRSVWGRTDTPRPEYNTAERRDQMWSEHPERGPGVGVRFGDEMLCHTGAEAEDGTGITHECAGAIILCQRELIRYATHGIGRLHPFAPSGLTMQAAYTLAVRMIGRGVVGPEDRDELILAAHPRIGDPAIGHDDLAPPEPGEFVTTDGRTGESLVRRPSPVTLQVKDKGQENHV